MSQFEQIKDQLSLGADYEAVAAKYRPIFNKIEAGALEREQRRQLPYEQIQWLKQAGFGALRVPVAYGGGGGLFPQLF